MAGDWRNDGRGVRGCAIFIGSLVLLFCGSGVDGNKLFLASLSLPLMIPRGALAAGDAKEKDRALSGEISAGPNGVVGPTLDDDVSVKVRCQGLSESKWWETVKENLDEEQEPILAVDLIEDVSNLRDEARG